MVRPIAAGIKKTLPPCFELDDLVSVGSIGLIQAAESYEPKRKVPFNHWAWLRIRGGILDFVGGNYQTRSGLQPRRKWRDAVHGPLTPALISTLGAPDPAGERAVAQAEMKRDLRAAAAALEPREQKLLVMHYKKGATIRATAKAIGLSEDHTTSGTASLWRACAANWKCEDVKLLRPCAAALSVEISIAHSLKNAIGNSPRAPPVVTIRYHRKEKTKEDQEMKKTTKNGARKPAAAAHSPHARTVKTKPGVKATREKAAGAGGKGARRARPTGPIKLFPSFFSTVIAGWAHEFGTGCSDFLEG